RLRIGGLTWRRAAIADSDPELGLQLAGPVSIRGAVLAAGRIDARYGIRVRQLGRESAKSESSTGSRVLGMAIVGRDGGRLDSGNDAHRIGSREADRGRSPQDGRSGRDRLRNADRAGARARRA